MKKLKGLSRKGNCITIQCTNRGETNWILQQINHHLGMHRTFSGSQWSKEQIAAMTKGKSAAQSTTHAGMPILRRLWKWVVSKPSIHA